jgi:uncharacterized NAD(P)/FAD-binding protein YdhS
MEALSHRPPLTNRLGREIAMSMRDFVENNARRNLRGFVLLRFLQDDMAHCLPPGSRLDEELESVWPRHMFAWKEWEPAQKNFVKTLKMRRRLLETFSEG